MKCLILIFAIISLKISANTLVGEWTTVSSIKSGTLFYTLLISEDNKVEEIFFISKSLSRLTARKFESAIIFSNSLRIRNNYLHMTLEDEHFVAFTKDAAAQFNVPFFCKQDEWITNPSLCSINLKDIPLLSSATSGPGERQKIRFGFVGRNLVFYKDSARLGFKRTNYFTPTTKSRRGKIKID